MRNTGFSDFEQLREIYRRLSPSLGGFRCAAALRKLNGFLPRLHPIVVLLKLLNTCSHILSKRFIFDAVQDTLGRIEMAKGIKGSAASIAIDL